MDLSRYNTANSQYLSFLTYSYGIIADIDIESEAVRFLGPLRFDAWAVWRVINLRSYRARFSYVPAGKHVELPPLGKPLSADWVTEEDDFVLLWASHVTHAGEKLFHSLPTKTAEGAFTVFIVR
jgi:sphingosine kinase